MAATAHDLRRMQNGHVVNGSLAYDLDWAVRERELRHAGEAPRYQEREIVREEPKVAPRVQVRERQQVSVVSVAGVAAELVKILVKLLLKGTSTAFVGDFANFCVGCAFVLPASIIYHAKPGKKTAIIGMAAGTLVMTVFGSAFNAIYLLPKFSELFGMPLDVIVGMGTAVNGAINSVSTLVLFAVVPFNLLKGVVVSLLTFLLYKRISPILHKGDAKKQLRVSPCSCDASESDKA